MVTSLWWRLKKLPVDKLSNISCLQLVYVASVYYFIRRELLFNQGRWRSNIYSNICSSFEDWSTICRWPLAFCQFERSLLARCFWVLMLLSETRAIKAGAVQR